MTDMDVWTAIITQRAVRNFSDRPIDEADLERILDAGHRAPSSKNTQPWEFVVVTDRDRLQELSRVGRYAGHLAGATVAVFFITEDPANPEALAKILYDVGHATQSMMLVAVELGIGSVHAAVYDRPMAAGILGLPPDRRCDYALSLGYPARAGLLDAPRRKVPRRPLAELVHRETW
jgi:nitroreductase